MNTSVINPPTILLIKQQHEIKSQMYITDFPEVLQLNTVLYFVLYFTSYENI